MVVLSIFIKRTTSSSLLFFFLLFLFLLLLLLLLLLFIYFNLGSSECSHVGSLFTNVKWKKNCLMTSCTLLPHMRALIVTSQTQTARHNMAALTTFLFFCGFFFFFAAVKC